MTVVQEVRKARQQSENEQSERFLKKNTKKRKETKKMESSRAKRRECEFIGQMEKNSLELDRMYETASESKRKRMQKRKETKVRHLNEMKLNEQ
jgi:hypothetical protein